MVKARRMIWETFQRAETETERRRILRLLTWLKECMAVSGRLNDNIHVLTRDIVSCHPEK